jgi:hypothetical protein
MNSSNIPLFYAEGFTATHGWENQSAKPNQWEPKLALPRQNTKPCIAQPEPASLDFAEIPSRVTHYIS